MHWLAAHIDALRQEEARLVSLAPPTGDLLPARSERSGFLVALQALVEEVARRPGILACVVEQDGLPLAAAGPESSTVDALAAMARVLDLASRDVQRGLGLGSVEQALVTGADRKIALVALGELSMAVLAPAETSLAQVLASPPET